MPTFVFARGMRSLSTPRGPFSDEARASDAEPLRRASAIGSLLHVSDTRTNRRCPFPVKRFGRQFLAVIS